MERRRLATILAVAGGATVLVVALVIALSFSGKKSPGVDTSNLQMTASIEEMLHGIPQHGEFLGDPKARVTLVEFADPQCTGCAQFAKTELPELIQNYVRPGELRIEYQGQTFVDNYPGGSTDSIRLLKMTLASGRQNKLWNFIEIAYANQGGENTGYATDDYLKSVAASVPGLNVDEVFAAASPTRAFATQMKASADRFEAANLNETPSFLIGRTGSKSLKPVSQSELTAQIDALLKS
jgi:protein-disulfide isomerase